MTGTVTLPPWASVYVADEHDFRHLQNLLGSPKAFSLAMRGIVLLYSPFLGKIARNQITIWFLAGGPMSRAQVFHPRSPTSRLTASQDGQTTARKSSGKSWRPPRGRRCDCQHKKHPACGAICRAPTTVEDFCLALPRLLSQVRPGLGPADIPSLTR